MSDHFTVMCSLNIKKPYFQKKMVSSRKLKSVDFDAIKSCIERSALLAHDPTNISQCVNLYNSELSRILDCHAPLTTRVVTIRPAAPWYNDEIKIEKKRRRQLERRWRASGLLSDRGRFTEQCRLVNQLLWSSRSRFYSKVVNENQSDQRKLFSTVDKLLHTTPDVIYPPHTNAEELATIMDKSVETI